jgi:hypothetical protein
MRVTQEGAYRRLAFFRLGASTASRFPHSLVAFLQTPPLPSVLSRRLQFPSPPALFIPFSAYTPYCGRLISTRGVQ